jgi:hypothetical protein
MKRSNSHPGAWTTAEEYINEQTIEMRDGTVAAIHGFLKWMQNRRLLTKAGVARIAKRAKGPWQQVGIYRQDVNALGRRFLDENFDYHMSDGLIFESLMPSFDPSSPDFAENIWGRWTGEKYVKQVFDLSNAFQGSDDFALCSQLAVMIDQWYDVFLHRKTHRDEFDVVRLVWIATGLIGMDGFEYFFSSSPDEDPRLLRTKWAFEQIDCAPANRAVARAYSLFRKGVPPPTPCGRSRIYHNAPKRARNSINDAFFRAMNENLIEQSLAIFIRNHEDAFKTKTAEELRKAAPAQARSIRK